MIYSKKCIGLFFGFLLTTISSQSFGEVLVKKVAQTTKYTISIEGLSLSKVKVDEKSFILPKFKETSGFDAILYEIGLPEIPVIRIYTTGRINIKIGKNQETYGVPGGLFLKPAQPSLPKIKDSVVPFIMDDKFYSTDAFWPNQRYKIEDAGSIRGEKQKLITIFPLQYNPWRNEMRLLKDFSIEVTGQDQALYTTGKKDLFAFVVGAKFKNSPSLAGYENLKKSLGFEIANIIIGQDATTPEDIRAKLKSLYANPNYSLKFALLIGDAEDVPGKSAQNISGITDHFYRAIDTANYDTDINGPDIGLGRISVSSEDQLAKVLKKYTRYQVGEFANVEWLNGASFLATDDLFEIAEGTHNYSIDTYTKPLGYLGFFPDQPNLGGDKLYAITYEVPNETVQKALQAGRTMIAYSGHGAETFWDAPNVTQQNVNAITHPDALPLVLSHACVTGDFRVAESFAETWQRSPTGAIMFWGSMDSSYWDEDDILQRRLFDGVYRNNLLGFGEMTNYALSELWKFYGGEGRSKYYWETYVTFGDPSILYRTKKSFSAIIDGPESLPAGAAKADYIVYDNTYKPLAKAKVAVVSDNNSLLASAVTDESGKVSLNLVNTKNIAISYLVMSVYGSNTKLTQQKIALVDANQPYLRLSDYRINGKNTRSLHIGEDSEIGVTVENIGQTTTQGGTIKLTTLEGPASMLSANTLQIPTLKAGQKYEISNLASFKANVNAASNELVPIKIVWQTKEGLQVSSAVIFKVIRGNIGKIFADAGQNQLGTGLKPGASGPVYLTITNIGSETLNGAVLRPVAGHCISRLDGEPHVNNLLPGETVRINSPLTVEVAASCKNDDMAEFYLTGNYQSAVQPIDIGKVKTDFRIGILRNDTFSSPEAVNSDIAEGGVKYPLSISKNGTITEIGVHVKLKYNFFSSLVVSIIHPSGKKIVLDHPKNDKENFEQIYGLNGKMVLALRELKGLSSKGTWYLLIEDENTPNELSVFRSAQLVVQGYLE